MAYFIWVFVQTQLGRHPPLWIPKISGYSRSLYDRSYTTVAELIPTYGCFKSHLLSSKGSPPATVPLPGSKSSGGCTPASNSSGRTCAPRISWRSVSSRATRSPCASGACWSGCREVDHGDSKVDLDWTYLWKKNITRRIHHIAIFQAIRQLNSDSGVWCSYVFVFPEYIVSNIERWQQDVTGNQHVAVYLPKTTGSIIYTWRFYDHSWVVISYRLVVRIPCL